MREFVGQKSGVRYRSATKIKPPSTDAECPFAAVGTGIYYRKIWPSDSWNVSTELGTPVLRGGPFCDTRHRSILSVGNIERKLNDR
jgi:hypothetical protein